MTLPEVTLAVDVLSANGQIQAFVTRRVLPLPQRAMGTSKIEPLQDHAGTLAGFPCPLGRRVYGRYGGLRFAHIWAPRASGGFVNIDNQKWRGSGEATLPLAFGLVVLQEHDQEERNPPSELYTALRKSCCKLSIGKCPTNWTLAHQVQLTTPIPARSERSKSVSPS
jgi:hypothetical protein